VIILSFLSKKTDKKTIFSKTLIVFYFLLNISKKYVIEWYQKSDTAFKELS